MLRKLKEINLEIGDQEEYFPSIYGFWIVPELKSLVVASQYPQKQSSIIVWVVEFDGKSIKPVPAILDSQRIKAFGQQQAKLWQIKTLTKTNFQSDKITLIMALFNMKARSHKIILIDLMRKNDTIHFGNHLQSQLSQPLYIKNYANILYAFHQGLCGPITLNQQQQTQSIKICNGISWQSQVHDLLSIKNLNDNIDVDPRFGFYCYEGVLVCPYRTIDEEEEFISHQIGIASISTKKHSFVNCVKTINARNIRIRQVKDKNFGVYINSQTGSRIEILDCHKLECINVIWVHTSGALSNHFAFAINTNGTNCISTQNSKVVIDRVGNVYWKSDKVGGLKRLQVQGIEGDKFLVSCCHSIGIYEGYEQEQDEQFMAM